MLDLVCFLLAALLLYAQTHFLRADLATLFLIICGETVLLNVPAQMYLTDSLFAFSLSIFTAGVTVILLAKSKAHA